MVAAPAEAAPAEAAPAEAAPAEAAPAEEGALQVYSVVVEAVEPVLCSTSFFYRLALFDRRLSAACPALAVVEGSKKLLLIVRCSGKVPPAVKYLPGFAIFSLCGESRKADIVRSASYNLEFYLLYNFPVVLSKADLL